MNIHFTLKARHHTTGRDAVQGLHASWPQGAQNVKPLEAGTKCQCTWSSHLRKQKLEGYTAWEGAGRRGRGAVLWIMKRGWCCFYRRDGSAGLAGYRAHQVSRCNRCTCCAACGNSQHCRQPHCQQNRLPSIQCCRDPLCCH